MEDEKIQILEQVENKMYAILPSTPIRNFLKSKKITDNPYDLVWFVTENKELATKVRDYFENIDGNLEMVQAMTLITDKTYRTIKCASDMPKFEIIEVGNDYWAYVESIEPPKPELRQTEHSSVMDFICVEGINNAFCFGGKIKTQEQHNKVYEAKLLNRIRRHFNNPNII